MTEEGKEMCLYPRLIDSSLSRVDERAKQRFDGLPLPAIDISIRLTLTRRERWLRNRERAKEKTSLLTIYLLATARKKKRDKKSPISMKIERSRGKEKFVRKRSRLAIDLSSYRVTVRKNTETPRRKRDKKILDRC